MDFIICRPAAEHARRAAKFLLKYTNINLIMHRNSTSHVPKSYSENICTEIDLIYTEVIMCRNCPPILTEIAMYRKRPNPL